MKTIAMIQARMSSSRLPGKVMKDLAGKPALQYITGAAQRIAGVDQIVVLTSSQDDDDAIAQWCANNKVECFRGDLNDVLKRFYDAARHYDANTILRLTADCPLFDPHIAGQLLLLFQDNDCDYASNVVPPSWPDGLDCEAFSMDALERAYKEASLSADREHVTRYIHRNRSLFKVLNLHCPVGNLSSHRWTLDTQDDFEFISKLLPALPEPFTYMDVHNVINKSAELKTLSKKQETNRSYTRQNFDPDTVKFSRSEEILKRAEKTIPLGSQTFSKSQMNCAPGYAPLFASHGYGGRIWDVDGNAYVDMVMGLLPTMLGYCDPDVDTAIREQLDKGITLSLALELEGRLAEKIISMVPTAEKVRFGKNGSDATSAAIRLARAFTGRDHIIVCGYHGWQDWYIGSTARNKGVPEATRDLTHKVAYNDLNQVESLLKEHPDKFAGLIMEPMNVEEPASGYFDDLKNLLHSHGVLLIFDEVITGFRYAKGGAQEYFKASPDLTALGKGMANGMPLSAITGRADVMEEMNNVFFSGTFGGEALSLAASLAVLEKLEAQPVIERLWESGAKIREAVEKSIAENELQDIISFSGLSPWQMLQFKAFEDTQPAVIKTFFTHESFKRGVLTLGAYNICYAHTDADIAELAHAHDDILNLLSKYLKKGTLEANMPYPPIQPVFQVRKNA